MIDSMALCDIAIRLDLAARRRGRAAAGGSETLEGSMGLDYSGGFRRLRRYLAGLDFTPAGPNLLLSSPTIFRRKRNTNYGNSGNGLPV
ncbi:MAG: hypothetical protein ACTSX7_03325 [Alphaproteobacteria bacterium]